jgi:phytoene/squalene synthetase
MRWRAPASTRARWPAAAPTRRCAPLLRAEAARARALLRAGQPLVAALPARAAWELRFTLAGGLRVLDKLEAGIARGRLTRPRLGPWDWVILTGRALRPDRRP